MNEDNYYDYNDEDWYDYIDDDNEDDCSEDYNSEDEDIDNKDPIYDIKKLPNLWVKIKLNGETFEVSSEGRIKLSENLLYSTDGTIQKGTPFKYIQILDKKYYIHHLVWSSFNGKVPDGWEIRHKEEYVNKRKRRIYSNHLSNLTIYPKNITEDFEISEP